MIDVIVTDKKLLTPKVCQLRLEQLTGDPLPRFQAGAHIDIHLPQGKIRQYSLCGDSSASFYEIAVQRESSGLGGSTYIHDTLAVGQVLKISQPRNLFALNDGQEPCLLFAAGIGITPIVSMAQACAKAGRPYQVFYTSEKDTDLIFTSRLGPMSNVHIHTKAGFGNQRLDIPACFLGAAPNAHIYVCGPAGFMDAVTAAADIAGFPPQQLHQEYFNADHINTMSDTSFDIKIASSGQIFTVDAQSSALATLEENGVFIPASCEKGICGTCVVGLVEGEAEHRDVFLTETEKASMTRFTPCCSRAKSGMLTLDI